MKPDIENKLIKKNTQLIDNIKNKIKYLKHHKYSYVYTISGSTHKLENNLMSDTFNTNKLSKDALHFISVVRKEILSSNKILDLSTVNVRANDITYFYVNKSYKGKVINDVSEVDIDRAYWDAAYILGYIGENVWKMGCEKDKVLRLMSLGGFAKKKYTFIFNPEAKNDLEREQIFPQSNPYQYVWYNISKYVSDCMNDIARFCGNDMVFFWVDAVFIKNKADVISGIGEIIKKYGFGVKYTPIKSIEYKENGEINVADSKHEDGRMFNTPKKGVSVVKLISELNNYKDEQVICFE